MYKGVLLAYDGSLAGRTALLEGCPPAVPFVNLPLCQRPNVRMQSEAPI